MRGEHGPQPGHAGAKVTVACKLPHGLLLRVFDWETRSEPVLGGGIRDVKVAAARPEMVRVRGNAVPFGVVPRWAIEDGFALTPGVDKEFFDLWMEQNRNHAAVRAGLIFAFEKHEDAASEARNRASLKSGMEQLDPQNLPRGIQPADRRDE
jgi:hypothetical protein